MMCTQPLSVHHCAIEDVVGRKWTDYEAAVHTANETMEKNDLIVHIVVLAHGNDPSRIASTIATLTMLSKRVRTKRVTVWLSYQGSTIPVQLADYCRNNRIGLLANEQQRYCLNGIPTIGKTENIMRALADLMHHNSLAQNRQFVIFLDNDYLVYDAINVHLLYIPWVFNMCKTDGYSRNFLYIKGGGVRLKVQRLILEEIWQLRGHNEPVRFIELCRQALKHVGSRTELISDDYSFIPTRNTLVETIGPSNTADLEHALELTTQLGGRSNRALSCYLHARSDEPLAKFLSEFSFLLHGDQGTNLANWVNMNLASGYGLELSFLAGAARHPGSRVINAVGLPHAHHPKDDVDNFMLGVELFMVLRELWGDNKSKSDEREQWTYFSPNRLGYRNVSVHCPIDTVFYPSVCDIL